MQIAGKKERLFQWPLRAVVAARWPLGDVSLVGFAGAVVGLWHLGALSVKPNDGEVTGLHATGGFCAGLGANYHIAPRLLAQLDVGVDVYSSSLEFTEGEQTVFRRAPAVFRVGLGLAVPFVIR